MKTLNYIDPIFNPPLTIENVKHNTKSAAAPKSIGKSANGQLLVKRAKGATITDTNKNEFIDFYHTHGANILGHAPNKVLDTIEETLKDGLSNEMPTPADSLLATSIVEAIPSIDQVRLVSSGSVAVMSAIRLARAFTGKDKIIKFDGALHGNSEQFMVSADSDLEAISIASSKGIPREFVQHTISLPFNKPQAVLDAFVKYKDEIAAIIVEPVPSSFGVLLLNEGFLQFLRSVTTANQSLLIFDEVTTGFRPKISGAQGYFNVIPDLTVLGKIMGGGFSIGAFGGRKEIMSLFSLESTIDRANPLAVTAGLSILNRLNSPLFYETLNHKSRDFIYWLREITKHKGMVINSFQSMFSICFSEKEITNYEEAKASDAIRYDKFHKRVLENGIFLSPSQLETNFISIVHSPDYLNKTLEVIHQVLKTM